MLSASYFGESRSLRISRKSRLQAASGWLGVRAKSA
jgi:hypothetical protein